MQDIRKNLKDVSIGFVPTMGALHEGHLALIERSLAENAYTIVSIYLNETQFNDKNDLKNYPATLDSDLRLLQSRNVDCVFTPSFSEIYPDNYRYRIQENKESLSLCGKDRPGHFDGVLTVVMKLFNIIKPDRAYFGEKDYQQLSLIKGMVSSFFLDIDIVACPTQRDHEGLALSSRNQKLNDEDIQKARYFANQLKRPIDLTELKSELEQKDIQIDYIQELGTRRYGAVKIGNVRLIDNVKI